MWYPVKDHPERVGLTGWEAELSWHRESANWRQIRVVTVPLDATLPPRTVPPATVPGESLANAATHGMEPQPSDNIYRPEPVSPEKRRMTPARSAYIESMKRLSRGAEVTAEQFIRSKVAPDAAPGARPEMVHTRVAAPLQADPYRKRPVAEETWVVSGQTFYPGKDRPDKIAIISWRTEMRWDSKLKAWKVTGSSLRDITRISSAQARTGR
jgi:hypothetical protein